MGTRWGERGRRRRARVSARAGRGGVLFVEGEAGLGKTSILESARRLAEPDLRVGLAQGDAMETSLPFGVLDQALAALGGPSLAAGLARGH